MPPRTSNQPDKNQPSKRWKVIRSGTQSSVLPRLRNESTQRSCGRGKNQSSRLNLIWKMLITCSSVCHIWDITHLQSKLLLMLVDGRLRGYHLGEGKAVSDGGLLFLQWLDV